MVVRTISVTALFALKRGKAYHLCAYFQCLTVGISLSMWGFVLKATIANARAKESAE